MISLEKEDALIDDAIAAVESMLAPCSERAVITALALVGETLNQPVPADRVLDIYQRILGKLPPDLLRLAIERLLMEYCWPRFPAPADFYKQVDAEMKDREYLLSKLRHHKKRIQLLS